MKKVIIAFVVILVSAGAGLTGSILWDKFRNTKDELTPHQAEFSGFADTEASKPAQMLLFTGLGVGIPMSSDDVAKYTIVVASGGARIKSEYDVKIRLDNCDVYLGTVAYGGKANDAIPEDTALIEPFSASTTWGDIAGTTDSFNRFVAVDGTVYRLLLPLYPTSCAGDTTQQETAIAHFRGDLFPTLQAAR